MIHVRELISFYLFLNSAGANPWKVVEALRTKLKMHAAALQIPMGAEDNFKGVIDLLKWKALHFEGADGYVCFELLASLCLIEELSPGATNFQTH